MSELLDHLNKRHSALTLEQSSFIDHWKDLQTYEMPRRGRFLSTDRNKGDKRYGNIYDNTALLALRVLASGMMAGLTSPARPWFRLGTPDPGLMKFGPVKEWLELVERMMRDIFTQSNLYNVLPATYAELGGFATGAFLVAADFDDVIRCYPYTVGEYKIATNDKGFVDTIYNDMPLTVGQIVQKFGLDNVGSATKNAYDKGNTEEWKVVRHAIEPNDKRIPSMKDAQNMPWRSVYWEAGDTTTREPLLVSGYNSFPCMVPRWHVLAGDVYGTQCPGMDALGDTKQLQIMTKRKGQGLDKVVNPPLLAPSSLRNKRVSSLPGDLTFDDTQTGMVGLRPLYEVNFPFREVTEDIIDVRTRIDKAHYVDLFMMLSQSTRREITAREIEEKHEEKLLMLGPVLERLNDELLDPLIDRTFELMVEAGVVPDAPPELEGVELKVEYISILAQAQKAVGVSGINALMQYVGGVAQMHPAVVDKIDFETSVDIVAEMHGVPPKIVRDDDGVEEVREDRRQTEQMQTALASAAQAAPIAKDLSQADTEGKNLLTDLQEATSGAGAGAGGQQ